MNVFINMRKNIFEVSEEEKKQIIKSHIEATKKNYLFESDNLGGEWETTVEGAKKIIEMLCPIKSADIKINYENGCYSTLWIDNFGDENLQVIACKGGWIQIRETQNYKGVTGQWAFRTDRTQTPTDESGKISILGQNFEVAYRPATPEQSGSLMSSVFCKFMTSSEVCGWDFWENWSWNADSLKGLEINKCDRNKVAQCWKGNENVGSGFWDSLLDLLPGNW